MKYLKIGELARETGIKATTIRYYERIGVFPKPTISESGYRQYNENSIKTAKFIRHAKDLGFSLKEVSELLLLRVNERQSCNKVKIMAETKIADVDKKINSLESLKERLIKLKNLCENKRYKDACPIIDILDE
ncbi:MAG: heavy metal-responsive transcriptional regulator [Deltaproteobacteria bacterium]|jgi:MerR family mercuric resistance operon transcriptional regulator|nr:heavy metal-responsive transcriptional regulator [Deltaproteobacteria bacterium]MCL5880746.1 heavy metal-responsive transcriptional regulator [Deltaproteobacteria bacterium]MDA8304212.1 heavy metal-responsive transcriptional regulator [Deltaproteobacteria bacterium]